jgi:preprotein translocase subunit SecF
MELIKPGININFVGRKKQAFLASGLIILITLASLLVQGGLNLGIDFAGGILVQVQFKDQTDAQSVKKSLTPIGLGDSLVQPFGAGGNEYLIRAEKAGLKLDGLSKRISDALSKDYKSGFEVRRVEMVGPKVGEDLKHKALLAIFYAIVMIAVYISGRFEGKWGLAIVMAFVLIGATLLVNSFLEGSGGVVYLIITAIVVTVVACWVLRLRYALGAIVALVHDVTITVGIFSVLDKEFTLAIVAAILTIIGYSLNDTIIVYDRIRENIKRNPKNPLSAIINASVNQTLSRTILTSTTTLIVLLSLYILGGGVIADFALALLAGVVVGTYSSVFVASPLLLLLPEGKPGFSFLAPAEESAPAPAKPAMATAGAASRKAPVKAAKAANAKKRSRKKKKR